MQQCALCGQSYLTYHTCTYWPQVANPPAPAPLFPKMAEVPAFDFFKPSRISDEDIERIADAVIRKLAKLPIV